MENEDGTFLDEFLKHHQDDTWVDDVAHVAWAFFALLLVAFWAPWWALVLAALIFAAPREYWDQRDKSKGLSFKTGWSRARDIAGFAVGGLLASGAAALVQSFF